MWKHGELLTVSVATQPHCQLHPPPLRMTLRVSEVQKEREHAHENGGGVLGARVRAYF